MDVLRIMDRPDFPQATDDERITLIRIANKLGGGGAGKLGRLWNSFPEARFPDVANKMVETRRWTPQHPPPPHTQTRRPRAGDPKPTIASLRRTIAFRCDV